MTSSNFQIGAAFPQTEIGTDSGAIREFAQAAEDLGFSHLVVYDHVLGADPTNRPDWKMPSMTHETPFYEPLTLISFLAGVTTTLVFQTGVVILPQRQTVLVAKQAACIDVLSRGRLRLGVGIGWNKVEYEGLGVPFSRLGERLDEQVALLRRLWTEPSMSFHGKYHDVTEAGLCPLPLQRPIPIVFGGHSLASMKRAARTGDGWFPIDAQMSLPPEQTISVLQDETRRAGRKADAVAVDVLYQLGASLGAPVRTIDEHVLRIEAWRKAGAARVSLSTMDMGHKTPGDHINQLRQLSALLQLRKGA